ncbi:unnamed protein product [Prorocentrum cordatum]|uniref:EF-hand domain-containing protein n=2 Tax=Prorocentrum cordatum TaxID=2364126 RepID=A0ABN9XJR7_9DINO|nr:unnamed protein product [Polarella glacialis]
MEAEPTPAERAAEQTPSHVKQKLPIAPCLEESAPGSPTAGQGRAHAANPTFSDLLVQLQAAHKRELEGLQRELRKTNRKITRMTQNPSDESRSGADELRRHGSAGGQDTANDTLVSADAWVPGSISPTGESESGAGKARVHCGSSAQTPHDGEGCGRSQAFDGKSNDTSEDESSEGSREWTGWDPRDFGIRWNPFVVGETWMSNLVRRYIGPGGEQVRKQRRAYKIVRSMPFAATSYVAIVLNSLFIGVTMQNQMNAALAGKEYKEAWSDAIELLFVVFFTIELFIKVLAEDYYLLFSSDWTWNILDVILVIAALLQLLMDAIYGGDTPNVSLSRTIRLFRITRVLRVVRVVRVCQSLRVMIFAIFKSLDVLCWVLAVLLFFKYIFAMIFMHGTISYVDSVTDGTGGALSADEYAYVTDGFGTIVRAIVTLFECITGGRDWGEVYYALVKIGVMYGICFLIYVSSCLGGRRIGTVVHVTSGVAARDRDRMVEDEMKALKDYASDIKDFFEAADTDKSGQLSWDEFRTHLDDNRVKAYFQTLDLDIRQAHVLFKLLDCNDNGEVGIEEFLDGCLRLKGHARSLDLNLVVYQLETLLKGSSLLTPHSTDPVLQPKKTGRARLQKS